MISAQIPEKNYFNANWKSRDVRTAVSFTKPAPMDIRPVVLSLQ